MTFNCYVNITVLQYSSFIWIYLSGNHIGGANINV